MTAVNFAAMAFGTGLVWWAVETKQSFGVFLAAFDPRDRSGDLSNTASLYWGETQGGGYSTIGMLDEMGLYPRLISVEEIQTLALGLSIDSTDCE